MRVTSSRPRPETVRVDTAGSHSPGAGIVRSSGPMVAASSTVRVTPERQVTSACPLTTTSPWGRGAQVPVPLMVSSGGRGAGAALAVVVTLAMAASIERQRDEGAADGGGGHRACPFVSRGHGGGEQLVEQRLAGGGGTGLTGQGPDPVEGVVDGVADEDRAVGAWRSPRGAAPRRCRRGGRSGPGRATGATATPGC